MEFLGSFNRSQIYGIIPNDRKNSAVTTGLSRKITLKKFSKTLPKNSNLFTTKYHLIQASKQIPLFFRVVFDVLLVGLLYKQVGDRDLDGVVSGSR